MAHTDTAQTAPDMSAPVRTTRRPAIGRAPRPDGTIDAAPIERARFGVRLCEMDPAETTWILGGYAE